MREHSYELYLGPEYTAYTPKEIREQHNPPAPSRKRGPKCAWRKPVFMLSKEGKTLAWFESVADAANKTGINSKCISSVLRKRTRTAGGYRWEYDNRFLKPPK